MRSECWNEEEDGARDDFAVGGWGWGNSDIVTAETYCQHYTVSNSSSAWK